MSDADRKQWARALLLLLGLPVLAPALLFMRIGGKRWGRVPLVLVLVDVALLVALALRIPRLAVVAIVAALATAALYAWRSSEGSLEKDVCLGYSKTVVATLLAGALVTTLGLMATVPMAPLLHTSAIYGAAALATTKNLAENVIALPTRVEVRDGRVDPGRAYYRLPGPPAWFERMPPEQRSDALETWVPLEGTHDSVWVVFMGTNLVPMTAAIDGHLGSVAPLDAAALAKAEGLAAPPPAAHPKKHGGAAAPPPPAVERVILVGSPEEVAARTARRDETRISFDFTWAWLLAIGLVLVAFALWRSVEDPQRAAPPEKDKKTEKETALPT